MSEHVATIEWELQGKFRPDSYSRAHRWRFDGGAVVAASASPHVVPLPLSDASAIDPEEALVASVASCHMLWFLHLASMRGYAVTCYRDHARGKMGKNARGRMAMLEIVLRPEIGFDGKNPDQGQLRSLHHEAHERCFIANSLLTNVWVEDHA